MVDKSDSEEATRVALQSRREDVEHHLSVISTLTPTDRRFVAALLVGQSLTDAYLHANPTYDGQNARKLGWKLRQKEGVQSAIDEYFHAQEMGVHELIARMSQQARNEAMAYLRPNGSVDLAAIIRDGKQHLVKGTKYDKDGRLIVEFIPAFDSQVQIGRFLSIWTDKTDLTTGGEKLPDRPIRFDLANIPFEILAGLAMQEGPPEEE